VPRRVQFLTADENTGGNATSELGLFMADAQSAAEPEPIPSLVIPRWQWWLWLAGPEALSLASVLLGDRFPWDAGPSVLLVWFREGLLGAQISLAGAVAAWAPLPLPLRVGVSWAWIIAALGAMCLFGNYSPEAFGLLLVAAGVQWLFTLAMFSAAWSFGIRLVDRGQQVLQREARQFSLMDLMLFTAEIAVALGLARMIWPQFVARGWDPLWLYDWLALAGGNLLLFNAVVTCFHVPRPVWKNVLLSAVFALLITGLEVFALWRMAAPGNRWPGYIEPLLLFNAAQLAWLLFALWRLERFGIFLRRVRHRSS
jgi:hypothetical protein